MKQVADSLTVDLRGFRDKIQAISRRGKATISVMERENAPIQRIEGERQALRREVIDLRVRQTAAFGEVLSKIIADNDLA
jgi:hypothetical protein